jgi:hypothetical protein
MVVVMMTVYHSLSYVASFNIKDGIEVYEINILPVRNPFP